MVKTSITADLADEEVRHAHLLAVNFIYDCKNKGVSEHVAIAAASIALGGVVGSFGGTDDKWRKEFISDICECIVLVAEDAFVNIHAMSKPEGEC